MKSFRMILSAALMISAVALFARADDEVNPQYAAWAKFKPGAYATMSTDTTTKGKTITQSTTTKLVKISADKATIQTSMSVQVMGNTVNTPGRETTIPAKGSAWKQAASSISTAISPTTEPTDAKDVKTGTEDIKVGDKTVSTTWNESTVVKDGMTIHSKTWRSDTVPGGMVKMTSETTGKHEATINSTLTDFSTGG